MFQAAGVEIVGVSADSQETQDRFARSLGLKFPLLGDPGGTIRDAYQVKWPLLGLARRTTYVIGRDQRIRQAFRSERDPDAHVTEACQFVARRKPPAPPAA